MNDLITILSNTEALIPLVVSGLIVTGLAFAISKTFQKLSIIFKSYQRFSRKKELIRVKNTRHDDRQYQYELQKAQNWFIVFLIFLMVNFYFLVSNNVLEYSIWLFLLCMTPTFIIEIFWLNQLSYVEDLRVYQKGSLEWKKRKQRKIEQKKRRVKRLK